MLAFISFLDSREKAILVWTLLLLAYVLRKDRSIASSMLGVLRSMFAPKLAVVWITAAAYCAALVVAADLVGLWHTSAIKETVYWFIGSGAVLTGGAMIARTFDEAYAHRIARNAVRFTLLVEFLVTLYVMPLAAELVLVPLIALILMVQVVAEHDPNAAAVKKLLDRTLALLGLGVLAWVSVRVVSDPHWLLTRQHAESLLLPPALTLAFVPFLYAMWRWSRWDHDRIMRRWHTGKLTQPLPGQE
jgi:hypothetical protein